MRRGREYLDCGEVGMKARNIASKQRQMFNRRMGTNIKIRQRSVSKTAAFAISQKTLASQESCFPGKRIPLIEATGESGIQRFDGRISDRHLGIDDGIDDQRGMFGTLRERASRPSAPLRIVSGDVQQNIAVHQDAAAAAQTRWQTCQDRFHLTFPRERPASRVNAMISSVLMRVSAVPRSASSARFPLVPVPTALLALRMRA